MEEGQIRAAGEKLLESHQVEKVRRSRRRRAASATGPPQKPRLEAAPPPARPQAEAPTDRVKLYGRPGVEQGWTAETLMSALSELAGGLARRCSLADVKQRYATCSCARSERRLRRGERPALRDKAVRIEVARPKRSR